MARKRSQKSKKKTPEKKEEPKITLKDLNEADSSGDEMPPESEWNEETKALYGMIKNGDFDNLIAENEQPVDDDDESFEEVELDDEDTSNRKKESAHSDSNSEASDDRSENTQESENKDDAIDSDDEKVEHDQKGNDESPEESNSKDTDEPPRTEKVMANPSLSSKALHVVTKELEESKKGLAWRETFDIVPEKQLPFGENGADGNVLDIHDDLKREVAFYDLALDAVHEARERCDSQGVPFQRPDDFFAEMVKTDDHMAKVKDRLIFESKKIEAFAQRKSNKEQKLRAKESHANRLAEKAKRKRNHMEAVQEWAESAAANRGRSYDDTTDEAYLQALQKGKSVNRKRQAFDGKYGFGGKRGRFKQNASKDLNSPKGFNPRGNFEGGMKKTGSGSNRKGKRARDASRSRRR